ncbi:hypothetical protein PSCLAVI8L_130223 [Pseudoclavibacter sp. 8L]|nr:hypothetical protein PSCLAVI8L_130223 [Pseudoclavibacter sp. 8L]
MVDLAPRSMSIVECHDHFTD